jgi:imidazole glycerol-phosphate synthase subunit HisH
VIALLDYGAGNLTSVRKGLHAAGAQCFTPSAPEDIGTPSGIIIPGVGHFAATRAITEAWRQALLGAIESGVPVLGICLGMQYLFDGSDEAPDVAGLGLLRGRCALLPPIVKVPHVGWNDLQVRRRSRLLGELPSGTQAYFTHSYAAPVTDACVASTEHAVPFAAVVERNNLFGVQFHPEKSSRGGLEILRAFVQISKFPDFQISRFPNVE